MSTITIGDYGQHIATTYLATRGYTILTENFRIAEGEIDVVTFDQQAHEIAFVEVKALYGPTQGRPEESVTRKKLLTISMVAACYCALHKPSSPTRIDVIAILINRRKKTAQIKHWKNVGPEDVAH